MKQDLYANEWLSAETQSTETNLKPYREDVFLVVSPKTVFEKLNLVKSYDKTNPIVFVFSLSEKYRRGLTSFGQYILNSYYAVRFSLKLKIIAYTVDSRYLEIEGTL